MTNGLSKVSFVPYSLYREVSGTDDDRMTLAVTHFDINN